MNVDFYVWKRSQPVPLKDIVESVREIKGANIWRIDLPGNISTNILAVARAKKDVVVAYNKNYNVRDAITISNVWVWRDND